MRDERGARDRGAAGRAPVVVDRVGHADRSRPAVGGRPGGAMALPHVPAVVRSGLREIDLLPRVLAHVVDEEPRPGGIRVEADPERIAQPPRERLPALEPRGRAAGRPAVRGAGAQDIRILGDVRELVQLRRVEAILR